MQQTKTSQSTINVSEDCSCESIIFVLSVLSEAAVVGMALQTAFAKACLLSLRGLGRVARAIKLILVRLFLRRRGSPKKTMDKFCSIGEVSNPCLWFIFQKMHSLWQHQDGLHR